jgi:hypothetical protein
MPILWKSLSIKKTGSRFSVASADCLPVPLHAWLLLEPQFVLGTWGVRADRREEWDPSAALAVRIRICDRLIIRPYLIRSEPAIGIGGFGPKFGAIWRYVEEC